MYTKTQWVDNTTPIDKDNLNKIEQGIYDNSLVVDAVTNTLNPRDTETYKTAELTEGQITDVIGVNDIIIKGQTSQDGTPTPSAPVDINVVSGSNVINTGNENLFPLILNVEGTQIYRSDCNIIIQKDEFIFTATGGDMYFGAAIPSTIPYSKAAGKLIKIPEGAENIYLKMSNNAFNKNMINFFDENKVSLGFSGISTSKEIPSTAKYFTLRIGVGNSVSGTTYKTKVMVSTMNKAYISHQSKELLLDLPVENFLDVNIQNPIGTILNKNGITAIFKNGYLSVKGKSTAVTDIYIFGNWSEDTPFIKLKAGTYTITSSHKKNAFYVNKKESTITNTGTSGTTTITLTEDTDITNAFIRFPTGVDIDEDIYLQIEKGSKANAYTPYGTDPIELCKIGDYQDYFYKSGSKWYLHKEIRKVVLNENASLNEQSQTGFYRYVYSNNLIKNDTSLANSLILFSNYFKVITFTNRNTELDKTIFSVCNGYSGHNSIQFNTKTFTSLSNFKTWLASNNVTVYYILETSTNTEITDTTLISQLEAIYNAPLYEQTNITQENNDLPMVLDITACKDNINGIKAFIRK